MKLAIIGATGLVGRTVIKVLEEKNLPIDEYFFLASSKSKGKKIKLLNKEYIVQELLSTSFDNHIDYAIFCAGGNISKKFAPIAVSKGTIVIDNSSYFRMNKDVPLIVPEINKEEIKNHKGIISNPNCSTIQAILPLKPLNDKYKIKRIVFSTYQAVSGAGYKGINDLKKGIENYYLNEHNLIKDNFNKDNLNKNKIKYNLKKFPYPIFNNCIPHIDDFLENGYTKEEEKMINETKKILNLPNLKITATTVRVPVFNCHSESINIEFEDEFNLNELKNILSTSSGIIVKDDIKNAVYPTTLDSNNKNQVFVGRIRRDFSIKSGINLWTVSDNLRKGAATNAIQILEYLLLS